MADGNRGLTGGGVGVVVFVFFVSGALNLLYFAPSLFMMQVYDRVLPTQGVTTLVALSAIALVAFVTIGILDWVRARVLARLSRLLDIRMAPVVASVQLSAERTDSRHGERSLTRSLDILRAAIPSPPFIALMDLPWTPLFLAATALIHPAICLLVSAGLVLVAIPTFIHRRRPVEMDHAIQLGIQEFEWNQADTIRALGMRPAMIARFERGKALARDQDPSSATHGLALGSASRSLRMALQMAVLALGALLAIEKQISAGSLFAAALFASRALAPAEQLAAGWRHLTPAFAAFGSLRMALGKTTAKGEASRLVFEERPSGRIDLEDVGVSAFRGGPLVLKGASFSLRPGDLVGVVGPSGAGKSSLARIVAGAQVAGEGVVRVDGVDIRQWDPDRLGRHVGYLPQELALFSGSIADNISRFEEIGASERTRLVLAAARAAGAHDLIARLPDGYETLLSANGRGLSAGQTQRIALARALYGDPALLVLDEPNAFLDGQGETALVEALVEARNRGAACMVIAHRAGVMNMVDRVLMVRDGRIEEIRKEDLLARRVVATAGAERSRA